MSCCVFQLGQSPLVFVLWERLLHWKSGTCMLRLVSGLDTQENLLYLKLCGYISSAWAADRQQLGPSSQYLWAKWPLGLRCWQTPSSGLFHNLGGSQGYLVDLTQIPLADGIACCLSVDCSLGSLAIEIFGNVLQVSAEHVSWSLKECRLSLQSPFWESHRGKLMWFPEQPFLRDTSRGLDGLADSPTRHACAGKCGKMCTGRSSYGGWARYSHVKQVRQGWWKCIPTAQQNWLWVQSWSKEGSLLEQIQLKIWANILFQ